MRTLAIITAAAVALVFAAPAIAEPVTLTYDDGPQDPLWVPHEGEELGTSAVFPTDELIEAPEWRETDETACTEDPGDDPGTPNIVVKITNRTGRNFPDVWYVADTSPDGTILTELTNYDGAVNGWMAFKIDRQGVNRPLIDESLNPDEIFEAGETWEFIIQDYGNRYGEPPSALGSVGVGENGDHFGDGSTGSIVVPEPVSLSIVAAGGVAAFLRKRRTQLKGTA